jgi:CO/xanthine dehydrogenase FAD-binding subunit
VAEFVTWPNQTTLQPGELLTHFTFTAPPAGVRTAFSKLGRRNAQSISRLSMAAMGRVNPDNVIDFVRLTPGAATPRTARMAGVEALLLGRPLSAELLAEVGAKTAALMVEITGRRWSTEYKEIAIAALAERTLRQVLFI